MLEGPHRRAIGTSENIAVRMDGDIFILLFSISWSSLHSKFINRTFAALFGWADGVLICLIFKW